MLVIEKSSCFEYESDYEYEYDHENPGCAKGATFYERCLGKSLGAWNPRIDEKVSNCLSLASFPRKRESIKRGQFVDPSFREAMLRLLPNRDLRRWPRHPYNFCTRRILSGVLITNSLSPASRVRSGAGKRPGRLSGPLQRVSRCTSRISSS